MRPALWVACVLLALVAVPAGLLLATRPAEVPAGHTHHYRLPWAEGSSFMFTEAPGGRTNPHFLKSNLHAVDIAMPEGTPVLAARGGEVEAVEAGQGSGLAEDPATFEGNFVRVRHADGTYATYAHLRGVEVRPGQRVATGQVLGDSGSSGDVARAQLHFGVSRLEQNAAGRWEEVSLPIVFTVGDPAFRFEPRVGLMATPRYGGPAELPRYSSEPRRLFKTARPPTGDEQINAWLQLAAFLAFGVAGMLVSWRMSRG